MVQDATLKVFVDNCTVRNKLCAIVGRSTDVKLDVFHAIQRVTRKIPKRHPLFNQCKNKLKPVVRKPSDTGESRKDET